MALTHGHGLFDHPRCVSRHVIFYIDQFLLVATSVDVERLFSHGQVLLSHNHNRLSAQTTRALLCLLC